MLTIMTNEPLGEGALLKDVASLIDREDILIDAFKDLIKDEIKSYIKAKLDADPALRREIKEAVGEYLEAKVNEGYAALKLTKAGAKLGLNLVPPHLRSKISKEFLGLFEKELTEIIEKTL